MNVEYQKTDDLNARMRVVIAREDYEPKFLQALQDYRQKANFKGFRKGKTPMTYIRKLVGQDVLTRTVTEMLSEAVNGYLKEHEIPYIGQPLPVPEQAPASFDPFETQNVYEFSFDIGLLPDFEIQGLDQEITWHDIQVSEEQITEEWNNLLKRKGTYVPAEIVTSDCRISLRLREMENLGPKPDGREQTRTVSMEALKEPIRAQLTGKKTGDMIRFDPDHFLTRGDGSWFSRFYMGVNEGDAPLSEMIEAQILSIEVLTPAQVNQELFDSAFTPGKVSTEEEARKHIGEAIKHHSDQESDTYLRHMIEHRLIDANQFELPYAFITRLLNETREEGDKDTPPPSSEQEANSMRWHFVKSKLIERFGIEVTEEEIRRALIDHVINTYGSGLSYDQMRDIIYRNLEHQETVARFRNSVADTKLFYALKEHMPVVKKPVSRAEFDAEQEHHTHTHHR